MTSLNSENINHMNWKVITDEVMGGKSKANFNILNENNKSYLRLEGHVSTENNGGFIQIRTRINLKKNISSIRFQARGNNEDYFIHIRTPFTLLPWQYYSSKFHVTNEWKTYNLNFKNFTKSHILQPSNFSSETIKTVAFVAYGKDYSANLELKEINFMGAN